MRTCAIGSLCLPGLRGAGSRRHSGLSRAVASLRAAGERLTGQADVLRAQAAVRERREALRRARSQLQSTALGCERAQEELRELYARKVLLYQDPRRDIASLAAIHASEEALLRREQELASALEADRVRERESFGGLSDAIAESHEVERSQSERTRYYSRVGSLLGALVGFLGSQAFFRGELRRHHRRQEAALRELAELLRERRREAEEEEGEEREEGIRQLKGEVRRMGDALNAALRRQETPTAPPPPAADGGGGSQQQQQQLQPPPAASNSSGAGRELVAIALLHVLIWVWSCAN